METFATTKARIHSALCKLQLNGKSQVEPQHIHTRAEEQEANKMGHKAMTKIMTAFHTHEWRQDDRLEIGIRQSGVGKWNSVV